jgi:mannose-1-phosphate guanylyltransferase/mannose-6-phosphate isomerase
MTQRIIPAIMSGGAGTRLWPASTGDKPKQFHVLGGANSLFQDTISRVVGGTGGIAFCAPIVLCNHRHADLVEAELAAVGVEPAAIVLEPAARNTAAVAAIAAAVAGEIDLDALVLLLPADHLVADTPAFHAALARAAPFARERIVTFGITPARAATGYGYIRIGAQLGDGVFGIDSFREKPSEAVAEQYLADGGYAWNAGIFLFHPRTLLEEFDASADIREGALSALAHANRTGARIVLNAESFTQIRASPLDIAVMEKTTRAAVVPCDIGWADVGSWDEIWRLLAKDAAGNAIHGPVAVLDGANNLLRSDGVKICVAGVSNLIVVATPDAIIIVPRDRAQDVKLLRDLVLSPTGSGRAPCAE